MTDMRSDLLSAHLMFRLDPGEDKLVIECNFCYSDGYKFYDGLITSSTVTDWIAAAVAHISANHS